MMLGTISTARCPSRQLQSGRTFPRRRQLQPATVQRAPQGRRCQPRPTARAAAQLTLIAVSARLKLSWPQDSRITSSIRDRPAGQATPARRLRTPPDDRRAAPSGRAAGPQLEPRGHAVAVDPPGVHHAGRARAARAPDVDRHHQSSLEERLARPVGRGAPHEAAGERRWPPSRSRDAPGRGSGSCRAPSGRRRRSAPRRPGSRSASGTSRQLAPACRAARCR